MSVPVRYNLVTFVPDGNGAESLGGQTAQRLYLKMETAYVRQPGVTTQNLLAATLPYTELEKLGDLSQPQTLEVKGKVEFWYRSAPGTFDEGGFENLPAFRLYRMRLIDAEPVEWGYPVAGGRGRVMIYRIHLADERERFADPRGGRLADGQLNTEPFFVDDGDGSVFGDGHINGGSGSLRDKNGNRVLSNGELIQRCLDEMGIGDVPIPPSVHLTSALRNLEWRGNHAPTELQHILDAIGHIFYVRTDGSFRIERIGDGSTPELNLDQVIEQEGFSMPAVDRRGRTVIFASCPNPVVNTHTVTGLGAKKWQFVLQDSKDRWRTIDQCDLLKGKSGVAIVRGAYQDIDQPYRARVAGQLYRCLRLDPAEFGPGAVIYRRLQEGSSRAADVKIEAKIAYPQQDGSWKDSTDYVRLSPSYLYADGTIVQVRERCGKLKSGVTISVDPLADFEELAADQLRGRVMTEVSEKLEDGTRRARYYMVGFTAGVGGAIRQLSEGELKSYLEGKESDRLIVARPELQLRQVEGEDQNRAELEMLARNAAFRFVKGTGDPAKMYVAKGFMVVNLSGKVPQWQVSQDPPETRWHVNTWWMPHATYLTRLPDKEGSTIAGGPGSAGAAFPHQHPLAANRAAMGTSGATQPAALLSPIIDDARGDELFYVALENVSGSNGTKTSAATWKYKGRRKGVVVFEEEAPEATRQNGRFTPATVGIARINEEGKVKLLVAFEVRGTVGCS